MIKGERHGSTEVCRGGFWWIFSKVGQYMTSYSFTRSLSNLSCERSTASSEVSSAQRTI